VFPSVLCHCWLGEKKGIQYVKKSYTSYPWVSVPDKMKKKTAAEVDCSRYEQWRHLNHVADTYLGVRVSHYMGLGMKPLVILSPILYS